MSPAATRALLASIALPASAALAADGDAWEIAGSNTARAEYYSISGDEAASPYAFDGVQAYDEINLNVSRRFSPYRTLRGQLMGLLNDSDYRFPDSGLQAERVNLYYEDGTGGLPMRLEGGDTFSYLSYRTFQRSIKGAQFEMQPRREAGQARHSLLFFSGANQAQWNDWDWSADNSTGASWLVEQGALGSLSLNVVYNEADAASADALRQEQWVSSLAGETNVTLGGHNINLEAEYAYFDGDHGGDFDPEDGQDRDDSGVYAQLMGQAYRQLSYRLRYEEYGYDFRPRGSVVFNDRRSYEGHLGWQFRRGVSLRGRMQAYEDRWDSVNQLDTDIVGVDLTGNLFALDTGAVTGRVRVFREQVEDAFNTTDRDTDVIDASANLPLGQQTSLDLRTAWRSTDDAILATGEEDTIEIDATLNRQVSWGEFSGAVSPGISYRDVDAGPSQGDDWSPTIAINLSSARHSFRASYNYLDQNRDAASAQSVSTQAASLHYHYALDRHELGIDANWYDREPNAFENTQASRVSVYWTWYFDRPAAQTIRAAAPSGLLPAASLDGPMPLDAGVLTRLSPGQSLEAVLAKMATSGAPSPSRQGDVVIYELPLISSVTDRQRVAISHRAGVVDKVALIVDLEDDGPPQSAQQSFEQLRDILLRREGAPAATFETGEFGADYRAAINSNRLIRTVEWQTGQGVLRLGIPRRVDNAVRIELQHAPAFAPPRNTLWSINEVR
ncbi:MAG: hypothetical protein KDI09_20455 [Halioglobus sp.]|nr:hypothetical protein [Halioglobus sp.]